MPTSKLDSKYFFSLLMLDIFLGPERGAAVRQCQMKRRDLQVMKVEQEATREGAEDLVKDLERREDVEGKSVTSQCMVTWTESCSR